MEGWGPEEQQVAGKRVLSVGHPGSEMLEAIQGGAQEQLTHRTEAWRSCSWRWVAVPMKDMVWNSAMESRGMRVMQWGGAGGRVGTGAREGHRERGKEDLGQVQGQECQRRRQS